MRKVLSNLTQNRKAKQMIRTTRRKYNQSLYEQNRLTHNYSPTAKRRGKELSKFKRAKFLAWDGEGLQLQYKQVYGLLANSDGDYIIDTEGISTRTCLEFLTSPKYSNNTIHCCFGASYDVNMFLRDLPEELLRQLHIGNKFVRWHEFELEYRARKSFTIRRLMMEERNGKLYPVYNKKKNRYVYLKIVTLWDVFGFFQKKFVGVLEEWTKNTIYEKKYKQAIIDIQTGKDKRGAFTVDEVESFVLPYCLVECEALRDIMKLLQSYLDQANLVLDRWDGAGAVAASLLKRENIKKHIRIGEHLEEEPYPQEVELAGEYAYFGGWIEAFMLGHIDMPVYHYDIGSAYPCETADLKSLTQGKWLCRKYKKPVKLTDKVLSNLTEDWLAHIHWTNGHEIGPNPFSWRNEFGTVSRPVMGKGWQWSYEIKACYELDKQIEIYVDTIYYFVPNKNCEKPFAFLHELYELRRKMKKEGNGVQMIYKLGMNSIYGKLAQSLGYNKERKLKPPYHCSLYAGMITSKTRAKIYRAVMQNPKAIISIATDGIYSLVPLKLDIGEGLGQWEHVTHDNMTIVQPGFYWYETNGIVKHYYRGFNDKCVSREQIIEAYNKEQMSIDIPVTRFITLGAAIGLNNFALWRTWRTQNRTLDLIMESSNKRLWGGETLPGKPQIKITRAKIYNPMIFKKYPDELESRKYQFDWDNDREHGQWDGQSARLVAEEMFTMEISPD